MLPVVLIIGFFVALHYLFLQWLCLKGEEQLAATNAWCDASHAFTDWRLKNPSVYIGLSEKGRGLLNCNLEAFDWFLRTHTFIDGKEHREWLISLFYELPPKP